MAIPFSPSQHDVERYRRFRALCTEVSNRMVETIPMHVFHEVGAEIGILRSGVLVFDNEDMQAVLWDCCLNDWFENGKNLVQRYAEVHPAQPGTDESYLLSAYTQAKYRVLVTESLVPGAGVQCRDVIHNEDLFLMDLAMSRSLGSGDASRGRVFASRTIPLGEYHMTTGAMLPINSREVFEDLRRIDTKKRELWERPGGVPLLVVRACIAAGAANAVRYETVGARPKKHRIEPKFPGFKRRRRLK